MLRSLLLSVFMLSAIFGRASHIVGSDIYYDYLGNDQYRITLILFRDCASTGAAFDNPASVGIYNSAGQLVRQLAPTYPGSVPTPVVFNNPCVSAPSGICVESATYIMTTTLPPSPGGYTVTYQRCCYGNSISNIINPDDMGLTVTTHIPGTPYWGNSSPRFANYPPLVICNNEDLNFDHFATDPDGDSLAYDMVTPFNGGTSFNPAPDPPSAPPYSPIIWETGFNAFAPLGPGSSTVINPITGNLFTDANQLGKFVVGIRVKEYRNGVLIGSTIRAFIFRVVNCIVQLQAEVGTQEESPNFVSYCQGLTWTFDNQSFGGSSYAWDFGVSGTTTDVSTAFEPTFTYPAPGIYTARLVVNPGWPCTDTTYVTLNLNNPLEVDFTFNDSLCLSGNSVNFTAQVNGHPDTQLSWDFGPNASIAEATGNPVNGVHFSSINGNEVTLVGEYGICKDTMQRTVFLFADPVADLDLPDGYECLGLTQTFENHSLNATDYLWDFGVPGTTTDVSTEEEPTFTFPAPGTYTVTLTSNISAGCSHTTQKTFTVYDLLEISFTHSDSLCITDNSFEFHGTSNGPAITTYSWNFGPNATPSSATTLDVTGVVYNQAGQFPVTLTASFLGCSETVSSNVFIFKEPTIDFTIRPDLQCAPFAARFVDLSSSDTPILYSWDFGDGSAPSNEQNPTHVYVNPGQYPVTLQIWTTFGCVDTLTLTKADLINVHPTPTAGFEVSPEETDICHAHIQFTDQSVDGLFFTYIFDDDNNAASTEQNPYYNYMNSGWHSPVQIVENEFGCSDTTRRSLYIEPFTVYIPNAFTPDGDGFNETMITVAALEAVEWEFRIYNRWGELVYTATSQYDEWDGVYKGIPAMEGLYTYTLRYISCASGERWEEITGHVSLLR